MCLDFLSSGFYDIHAFSGFLYPESSGRGPAYDRRASVQGVHWLVLPGGTACYSASIFGVDLGLHSHVGWLWFGLVMVRVGCGSGCVGFGLALGLVSFLVELGCLNEIYSIVSLWLWLARKASE